MLRCRRRPGLLTIFSLGRAEFAVVFRRGASRRVAREIQWTPCVGLDFTFLVAVLTSLLSGTAPGAGVA